MSNISGLRPKTPDSIIRETRGHGIHPLVESSSSLSLDSVGYTPDSVIALVAEAIKDHRGEISAIEFGQVAEQVSKAVKGGVR